MKNSILQNLKRLALPLAFVSVVPLAIACSTNTDVTSDSDQVKEEVSKIKRFSFTLKDTEKTKNAADISNLEGLNALLSTAYQPTEGVTVSVTGKADEDKGTIALDFQVTKGDTTESVTKTLGGFKLSDKGYVTKNAANLKKTFTVNKADTLASSQKSSIGSQLSTLNAYLKSLNSSYEIKPSDGVTATFKAATESAPNPIFYDNLGSLKIVLVLSKGAASQEINIKIEGFKTADPDLNAINARIAEIGSSITITGHTNDIPSTFVTTLTTLAKVKELGGVANKLDDKDGITIALKGTPETNDVSGTISVTVTLTKGAATKDHKVTLSGFLTTATRLDNEASRIQGLDLSSKVKTTEKEKFASQVAPTIKNLATLNTILKADVAASGTTPAQVNQFSQTSGLTYYYSAAVDETTPTTIKLTIKVKIGTGASAPTKDIVVDLTGFKQLSATASANRTAVLTEKNRISALSLTLKDDKKTQIPTNLTSLDALNVLLTTPVAKPSDQSITVSIATQFKPEAQAVAITFIISKGTGEDAQSVTLSKELSGFQTAAQTDQAVVDAIAMQITSEITLTKGTLVASTQLNNLNTVQKIDDFVGTEHAVAKFSSLNGVTIALKTATATNPNPQANDSEGSVSIVLSLSKGTASAEKTITIKGFKIVVDADTMAVNTNKTALTKEIMLSDKGSVLPSAELSKLDTLAKIKTYIGSSNSIDGTDGVTVALKTTTATNPNPSADDVAGTISVVLTLTKGSASAEATVTLKGFQTTAQANTAAIAAEKTRIEGLTFTLKTTKSTENASAVSTLVKLNELLSTVFTETDGITYTYTGTPNTNKSSLTIVIVITKGEATDSVTKTLSGFTAVTTTTSTTTTTTTT